MALPQIQKTVTIQENYDLVTTPEKLDSVRQEIEEAELIAVDTETEGLEFEDLVVGICLSTTPGTGYYIPIRHEVYEGVLYDDQLPVSQVYEAIAPALEVRPCVGHNVKFDWKMLAKDGVNCNFVHDTLAIAKLFGNYPSNGLKFLVKHHFKHEMADLASLFPKRGNKKIEIHPKILSPKEICNYAVEDANWTLQLFNFYESQIPEKLKSALYKFEMLLLPIVGEMESFGLPVSKNFLLEQGAVATSILDRLEVEILESVRERLKDPEYTLKLNSTPQLQKLLFEELGLPILEKTPKGKPSASGEVLEKLAELDPITRTIHTHRTLKKLNSTYLDGLVEKIQDDGRIRGNFNQFGTASGRFSSSNPNLQNLPRSQSFYLWVADNQQLVIDEFGDPEKLRQGENGWEIYDPQKKKWSSKGPLNPDGEGYPQPASDGKLYGVQDNFIVEMWKCKTRDFVTAPKDHYLYEADYSQVELRILAGESGALTLLAAYANEDDVHQATAAVMLGIPFDQVTAAQRHIGKTINFSLLYGAGAENIAKQLGIDVEEAAELIAKYFQNLPEIGEWIEAVKWEAKRKGYAETAVGRKRHFPMIRSNDKFAVAKEMREAVNFRIQGAAADVMKFALVRTHSRLKKYFGDRARIVSTVHDSVLIEAHESVPVEDLMAVLKEAMTGFTSQFSKKWPALRVDVKKGNSWASSKEVAWPENIVMPPVSNEEVPPIRIRVVGREREFGVNTSEAQEEQLDIFSGGVFVEPEPEISTEKISWIIECPKPLTTVQLNGLTEFLKERAHSEAGGMVKVLVPNENGDIITTEVNGTFNISLEDRSALRMKIGNCTLKQELDDIDPNVLSGVDFGL